jgi:hypothetical protein
MVGSLDDDTLATFLYTNEISVENLEGSIIPQCLIKEQEPTIEFAKFVSISPEPEEEGQEE